MWQLVGYFSLNIYLQAESKEKLNQLAIQKYSPALSKQKHWKNIYPEPMLINYSRK